MDFLYCLGLWMGLILLVLFDLCTYYALIRCVGVVGIGAVDFGFRVGWLNCIIDFKLGLTWLLWVGF